MMAYSRRFIIVVRADLAQRANQAATQADTDLQGGARTFTEALSRSGQPPAEVYWCNWQMTPAQATAIRTRLREHGATASEVTLVPAGGTPTSNRFAVFDAAVWSPDAVLQTLGLRTLRREAA